MAAGLAALGAHQIGADRLPGLRLRHCGGGTHHQAAGLVEARQGGRIEDAEGEADHRRRQLQQGLDLRAVVLAEARRPAAGRQAELGTQRVEAGLGAGNLRIAGRGIFEDEQVDVERALGQGAYAGHTFAQRCRRQGGGGEGAQRAGIADRGDQLRRGRPAGHGRLDQRVAQAEEGGEGVVDQGHEGASSNETSPQSALNAAA
ncbi:hypothetical protein D3C78_977920 [compost metagenome]